MEFSIRKWIWEFLVGLKLLCGIDLQSYLLRAFLDAIKSAGSCPKEADVSRRIQYRIAAFDILNCVPAGIIIVEENIIRIPDVCPIFI